MFSPTLEHLQEAIDRAPAVPIHFGAHRPYADAVIQASRTIVQSLDPTFDESILIPFTYQDIETAKARLRFAHGIDPRDAKHGDARITLAREECWEAVQRLSEEFHISETIAPIHGIEEPGKLILNAGIHCTAAAFGSVIRSTAELDVPEYSIAGSVTSLKKDNLETGRAILSYEEWLALLAHSKTTELTGWQYRGVHILGASSKDIQTVVDKARARNVDAVYVICPIQSTTVGTARGTLHNVFLRPPEAQGESQDVSVVNVKMWQAGKNIDVHSRETFAAHWLGGLLRAYVVFCKKA